VTSRGNNRADIFLDDTDRLDFLAILGRAADRFRLRIFAFCLMSNHYHLFLQTEEGNLSRAVQWINTTFATKFHYRHKRGGHFFQGRYHSVLVTDDAYWLHLSMYIHLNPVRAGMVARPEGYEWSSCRDYIKNRSRFAWLERDMVLSQYGEGISRFSRYQKQCLALLGKEPGFLSQIRSGAILGPKEMAEKLAQKYRPSGQWEEIKQYREIARQESDWERELAKVARVFKAKPEDLKTRHRHFLPRLAAYYHLVENCGVKVSETARVMNVRVSSVCNGVRRFRMLMAQNRQLQKQTAKLNY